MINPLIRETISTPIPETTGGLNITITEVVDSNDEVIKDNSVNDTRPVNSSRSSVVGLRLLWTLTIKRAVNEWY